MCSIQARRRRKNHIFLLDSSKSLWYSAVRCSEMCSNLACRRRNFPQLFCLLFSKSLWDSAARCSEIWPPQEKKSKCSARFFEIALVFCCKLLRNLLKSSLPQVDFVCLIFRNRFGILLHAAQKCVQIKPAAGGKIQHSAPHGYGFTSIFVLESSYL